jgi:hypothetical protein
MLGATAKDAEDPKIGALTTRGIIMPVYDAEIAFENFQRPFLQDKKGKKAKRVMGTLYACKKAGEPYPVLVYVRHFVCLIFF